MSKKKRRKKNVTTIDKVAIVRSRILNHPIESDNIHIHEEDLLKLPKEIARLSNLETLCLHTNSLEDLPQELVELKKLRKIKLSSNDFTKIPTVLFDMPWLEEVELDGNRILEIDNRIQKLSHLKSLRLEYNLFGAPREIFDQSPDQVISFLLNLKKGNNTSLNEAKVLLLGEANIGKTALVNKLTEDKYIEGTTITKGIKITKWITKDYQLNVWDFGGQEIMRAMHQFFMTERSLYLLLWNSREDDINGKIEDWLELIKTYGGNSPVILVLSKCDDGNFDPDEHRLKDDYSENLKFIVRTSSKENVGLDELKNHIIETVGELNISKDKVPNNWIEIKKKIEVLQENYINLNEYYDICKSNNVTNNNEQISLLTLLKDLGVAFNYGDKQNPHSTNILKPEWVTKGIYDIINSNNLFKKGGRVLKSEIIDILSDSGDYEGKEDVIIGLMSQFELCFHLSDDELLIPDLLPEKQPYIGDEFQDSLELQYRYKYMSRSIMPHFIARVNHLTKHLSGDNSWYWRSGIIIEKNSAKALIKLNSREKTLYISVVGQKSYRRELLDEIRKELDELHDSIKGDKPNILVPLPQNNKFKTSYKSLLQLEKEGTETIFVEDFGHVKVKELLDGIETEESRKVTMDSLKELLLTEQQKEKQKKHLRLSKSINTNKRKVQKHDDKLEILNERKQKICDSAKEFASNLNRKYKRNWIIFISAIIIICIYVSFAYPAYRFSVPLVSLIIALIIFGCNALEVQYSIKSNFDKHYDNKFSDLCNISGVNQKEIEDLTSAKKVLDDQVKALETQIECL
jgi:internalin A